ncbi:unnamed protein product [Camellia sinensis]
MLSDEFGLTVVVLQTNLILQGLRVLTSSTILEFILIQMMDNIHIFGYACSVYIL